MTGTELKGQVERLVNDTGNAWTPTQYLDAINASISLVANILIKNKNIELMDEITVNNGDVVPEYFMEFAGNVPVAFSNGRFVSSGSLSVKYFRMPTALTVIGDTIPFRDRRNIEALKLATAIYLKEQRGTFDMKNEKARLSELLA